MPLDDGEMRDLQFPLDRSLVPSAITPDETINDITLVWPTQDPDEPVSITLNLSLNEYVALASCIDVGSDIAYGDNAIYLWWLWVRSVNSMAFCEQVDDCIETNVATQVAINNILLSTGIVNPDSIQPITPEMETRFPDAERATDVSNPPPTCDKDELWSGILEIVTRIDELALDFLQDIVSFNDKAERIANIIDIVPLFGDIAADVITVFSDIAPDLLNGYLAHQSQQVIEETTCTLFELVCNDCRYPTYDEFYDHYASAGITGMEDILSYGITALMDFMIGSNNLANAVIWYTLNTGVLYTLFLGATFANRRGTKWLSIWANIGEESPSSAWEVLCDGCEDVNCIEYDFTVSDHSFVVWTTGNRPFGVYVPSVGWQCTWNSVSSIDDNRIYIELINMTNQFSISRIEFDYIATDGLANRASVAQGMSGTSILGSAELDPISITDSIEHKQVKDWVINNADGIRTAITTDTQSANQAAYTLLRMRIYYTSASPPDGGLPC